MPPVLRRCPLCGTPLAKGKYDEVLHEHKKLKLHEERVEKEAQRLKVARESLQAQSAQIKRDAARDRRELARQLRDGLAKGRVRIEKAAETKAQKSVSIVLRQERSALRKQEAEYKKGQSRQASYEKRLRGLTARSIQLAEENKRLKHQMDKGITPQIEGLLEEKNLLVHLKRLFPEDRYDHTGKGGDIVHTVMLKREAVGIIVYECKRCKIFQQSYVRQTAQAGQLRGAQYSILVTNVFPKKNTFFYVERDVIVLSPAGLEPVVHTARQSLINIHLLRATDTERQLAVEAVYEYLAGREFGTKIHAIASERSDLVKQFREEIMFHRRAWNTRSGIYRALFTDVESINGRLHELLLGKSDKQAEVVQAGALKLLPFPGIHEIEQA